MGISIKIGGVDKTEYVDARTLNIRDELTSKVNSASFDFICNDISVAPVPGESVLIEEGGTKLFSGRILSKQESFLPPNLLKYPIECIDHTRDLDKRLVIEIYKNQKAGDIIKDIITKYTTGFTTTNVSDGPTISKIVFDYIQVSEAITEIAEMCGYEWYVDYDKDIHFFFKTDYPAPFQLDDNQANYKDLIINTNISQLRNRIYVKSLGYKDPYLSEIFIGDGVTTSWTCKYQMFACPNKKLTNPTILPTGTGYGVAFSHDSLYLAVAHAISPYITIYKRDGDTFTKLDNPADLPTGHGLGVAFSHDNIYLAVGHETSPFITIYKRDGDTFTKLTNPADLPTGISYGIAFSHDSTYLAVSHYTTPYITIYKRDGDTFTKLADPADLPAGLSVDTAFSHDSTYLAVAHYDSPFITIYKRSGDTFTKLADPADLPAFDGYGTAFSHDSTYLAVAHETLPYITIYKRDEDTFTKLTNPVDLPAGLGRNPSFSHNSTYLAVGHYTTPYITIYKRDEDTFTKLTNPVDLPAGTVPMVSFSHDSTYLAIAHGTMPHITIYKQPVPSIILNSINKTVGWDGINNPDLFDFMYNHTTKVLSLGTYTSTPVDGDEIIITYGVINVTIMLRRDDPDSINTVKTIEGGDGIFEFCIVDNNIDSIAWANEAAKAELLINANPVISATFITNRNDIKSGQLITLDSTKRGIVPPQQFIVQSVELIRIDVLTKWPTIPYKPIDEAVIGYKPLSEAEKEYKGEFIYYIFNVTIATNIKKLEDLFLYLLTKVDESLK